VFQKHQRSSLIDRLHVAAVWIDCNVNKRVGGAQSALYKGLWIDGGALNNLPIHAFDQQVASTDPSSAVAPLAPGMLGFRLASDTVRPPKPIGALSFGDYISMVFETILSPASDGQIRNAAEKSRTVALDPGALTTLDFGKVTSSEARAAQDAAYKKTKDYFPSGS
jgi:hypothetical protein